MYFTYFSHIQDIDIKYIQGFQSRILNIFRQVLMRDKKVPMEYRIFFHVTQFVHNTDFRHLFIPCIHNVSTTTATYLLDQMKLREKTPRLPAENNSSRPSSRLRRDNGKTQPRSRPRKTPLRSLCSGFCHTLQNGNASGHKLSKVHIGC